jgi:hypothetical protein
VHAKGIDPHPFEVDEVTETDVPCCSFSVVANFPKRRKAPAMSSRANSRSWRGRRNGDDGRVEGRVPARFPAVIREGVQWTGGCD